VALLAKHRSKLSGERPLTIIIEARLSAQSAKLYHMGLARADPPLHGSVAFFRRAPAFVAVCSPLVNVGLRRLAALTEGHRQLLASGKKTMDPNRCQQRRLGQPVLPRNGARD
jgi:hypothetical protein